MVEKPNFSLASLSIPIINKPFSEKIRYYESSNVEKVKKSRKKSIWRAGTHPEKEAWHPINFSKTRRVCIKEYIFFGFEAKFIFK